MSDIRCVVCGEPWNSWGVNHGDMMAWETDLFRKGSGCPSCEGKGEGGWTPETIFDFDNGDEDPMERIVAYENSGSGNASEWKAPEDEIIHQCDGCGVQLVRKLCEEVYDGANRKKEYDWHKPPGSRAREWYISHSFRNINAADYVDGGDEEWNWHPWNDERSACPSCLQSCDDCAKKISSIDGLCPADPSESGYAILKPGTCSEHLCYDCYSGYCENCCESPCECESEIGDNYDKDDIDQTEG